MRLCLCLHPCACHVSVYTSGHVSVDEVVHGSVSGWVSVSAHVGGSVLVLVPGSMCMIVSVSVYVSVLYVGLDVLVRMPADVRFCASVFLWPFRCLARSVPLSLSRSLPLCPCRCTCMCLCPTGVHPRAMDRARQRHVHQGQTLA